jgi:hypothetical protein
VADKICWETKPRTVRELLRHPKTIATFLGFIILFVFVFSVLLIKEAFPEPYEAVASVVRILGPFSVAGMFVTRRWRSDSFLGILFMCLLWPFPWSFWLGARIVLLGIGKKANQH